jgi:hypothetical protein
MRSRDSVLLIGLALLATSLGYALLAPDSAAEEVRLPDLGPAATAAPDAAPDAERSPVAVDGGTVARSDVRAADPVYSAEQHGPDTTGWTSGVIAGDIELIASVVDRIESIQIVVDEQRTFTDDAVRPFRRIVPVQLGIGTPTYEVRDVPFSSYGYVVRVHSPGLNGSQQSVTIDEQHPYRGDVNLRISPGVPFSLLLRDQDRNPVPPTNVRLVPVGEPLGRSLHDGHSDNLGNVVFEQVLAGDYRVLIGPPGQPLIEPPIVTVQTTGRTYRDNVVQPQGQTIVVPRGMPLTVVVTDTGLGYGVEGAEVRAQAIDRTQLLVLDGKTDYHGRVTFPRLVDGIWEVVVVKEGFQRRSRQLTIKDGEVPPDLQFALARRY